MKSTLLVLALFLAINSHAQTDSKKILETLSTFKDQYDRSFNATISDSLVIIYISGLEDPLTMAYDKLKDKRLSNSQKVLFVGAFDSMHGDAAAKIEHLKNGFISKYGKDYVSVLLDAEGKLGKLTGADGLAVIMLKKNRARSVITSFGTKRKSFFDTINKYFN